MQETKSVNPVPGRAFLATEVRVSACCWVRWVTNCT